MSNLQPSGGVNQGAQNASPTGNPQAIGVPSLQPSGSNSQTPKTAQDVLGVNSNLSRGSIGSLSVTTSTGSPTTSINQQVTNTNLTPQTGFAVPAWAMILLGALVIIAGLSFIWSQRNDMTRLK